MRAGARDQAGAAWLSTVLDQKIHIYGEAGDLAFEATGLGRAGTKAVARRSVARVPYRPALAPREIPKPTSSVAGRGKAWPSRPTRGAGHKAFEKFTDDELNRLEAAVAAARRHGGFSPERPTLRSI